MAFPSMTDLPALLLVLAGCGPAHVDSLEPDSSQACEPSDEIPYDGQDQDCDGADLTDVDGDGYHAVIVGGEDCDDQDPEVRPGVAEVCNGIDDDCDGIIDAQDEDVADASTWYADSDGDGYGDDASTMAACDQPSGYVADSSDCDDADAQVNPAATEICNGADDDCDGLTDGQDADVADASTWYQDADGDGYGDASTAMPACNQPAGYVADDSDCDDGDAAVVLCGDTGATGCELGTESCPAESCAEILAEDASAASATYWIDPDGDGSPTEVSCDMDQENGGWTVLADYDFSTDTCPDEWVQHSTEGLCYGNQSSGGGQLSASFDALGLTWDEVLVEVCMRQYRTDDAFHSVKTVEEKYLDGLSLTYGAAGSRQHIFSWAIGHQLTKSAYSCPDLGGTPPPSFVGSDWECDSASKTAPYGSVWLSARLFEGDIQHLTLVSSTSEDLEGRIICNQSSSDEDVGICAFWLAIR